MLRRPKHVTSRWTDATVVYTENCLFLLNNECKQTQHNKTMQIESELEHITTTYTVHIITTHLYVLVVSIV